MALIANFTIPCFIQEIEISLIVHFKLMEPSIVNGVQSPLLYFYVLVVLSFSYDQITRGALN